MTIARPIPTKRPKVKYRISTLVTKTEEIRPTAYTTIPSRTKREMPIFAWNLPKNIGAIVETETFIVKARETAFRSESSGLY